MSNIKPIKPSHTFGYWRPWKEDSKFFDSYLDYLRDTSLIKYGADTVGSYINQASKEQVKAISDLGQAIGRGMNVLSNQMSDINDSLIFLNRNLDIQIEQQKLSNLLLQNIAELLRVPNSEKERQHSIELGIKFFVNASKDADLYTDALEELLKAESLMKQDYFVLHRIGCIYLYVEKLINPEKALEYFLRAGKYASVESDSNAVRLVNVLNNSSNSKDKNVEKQIGLLAADSYEKAAFAAYILEQFSDAVNYQTKALEFNKKPQNRFLLAKYQVRNSEISKGVRNLSQCIDEEPILAVASFKEIDLINEPEVLNLISNKNQEIDYKIDKLQEKWEKVESTKAANVIKELAELSKKSYEIKISQFKAFEKEANEINKKVGAIESEIDAFITQIKKTKFLTLDGNAIHLKIDILLKAKDLAIEKMIKVFDNIKKEVDADRLKIGAYYAGGIVIYIDETGEHGLVCSNKDFGKAEWGNFGIIEASGNGIANGSGIQNTIKIIKEASSKTVLVQGWFSKKEITTTIETAASLCYKLNYNGFSDWYLPTIKELELVYYTLKKIKLINFESYGYWSSTESDSEYAWHFCLLRRSAVKIKKDNIEYVRAVRAF